MRTDSTWPPEKPMSHARSSVSFSSCHLAGSTSSVSTPPVDLGCRNATRLPADAGARLLVDQLRARPTAPAPARRRCRRSGRPRGGARGRCARGTCPIAAVGSRAACSSSTCPSPTSSSTASTSNSSTVSRCCSRIAEAVAIQLDGGVEVLDGHADVVDPPEHGRGSLTEAARGSSPVARRPRARQLRGAARRRAVCRPSARAPARPPRTR